MNNETETKNKYDRDPREALEELSERYGDIYELVEAARGLRDYVAENKSGADAEDIGEVRDRIEEIIKLAIRIERATHPDEEPPLPEDEKDGPVVLLMSDCYWGRSRTFLGALEHLHGEVPRLMYVSADPTCRTDGMGSFCYNPKKPHFRVPLGRKLSGKNKGMPGTVEFYEPDND